jgi:hypothetical protein
MLKLALVTAALLAVSAAPAPASAAVLIHAPVKRAVCGDAITGGIWAQPGTRGSRTVRIQAIDRKSGRVWWHRKARARTSRWRFWALPSGEDGQCRPTTIVYRGPGFTSRFKVTFRSEGV